MKRESLSAFRHPSASALAKFRAAVSKLKKAGLIPPKGGSGSTRGKLVKPGSARPGDMFGGKPLRDYVRDKDNQAVIHNEAVVVAKSRVSDTQGYKVKKPKGGKERLIIPVSKDARVSIEKKNIVIRHESEAGTIRRVQIPRHNIKEYLSHAESLPELSGNRFYAFYFYGNRSHQIFRHAQDLVQYLTAYDALSGSKRKRMDAFRNIEILEINSAADWHAKVERAIHKRRTGGTKPYSQVKARLERMPEWKRNLYRQQRAAYMRAYRARKGK